MMKTNHSRGFTAKRYRLGQQSGNGYVTWSGHADNHLSDQRISASSTVASENSRSIARDRAGAKKYLRSRNRFHEKMALRKVIQNTEN